MSQAKPVLKQLNLNRLSRCKQVSKSEVADDVKNQNLKLFVYTFETELSADKFPIFEESIRHLVENLNWEDGIVKGMVCCANKAELERRVGKPLIFRGDAKVRVWKRS